MIETVGEDIAEITPARLSSFLKEKINIFFRGFSIDIMAGLTVLLGSNFGIPLSTTHCKVQNISLNSDKNQSTGHARHHFN